MQSRRLGSQGPNVHAIGLGCMYLSITGRPNEDDAVRTIHAALDAGITLFDTADVYCLDDDDLGHNERLLARALAGRSEKVTIATKGGLARPKGAWTRDASAAHLRKACERSLRALGVSAIDLYQLHAPDPEVPLAESVGELSRLHAEGKIKQIGLSNVEVSEIVLAQALVPIASVQNRWNPGHRSPERNGVLDHCTKHGIAFLPYSPFGGATGARGLHGVGTLGQAAAKHNVSPHRLVLAWMLSKSPVVIPIPGARRIESVKDSVAAVDMKLSAADLLEIEASFGPRAPN